MDSSNKEIYLDNAATTAVLPEVLQSMLPFFNESYGNPSSFHKQGKKSQIALDQARKSIANTLNCSPREIIFTSSATIANNIAIKGLSKASENTHIITTKIEHPSVSIPCKELEKQDHQITWLDVDTEGYIDLDQLSQSINKETTLVSIIYANNEIGTIQKIKEISQICKKHQVPIHIDACQAANTESLDVEDLGIDLMTINSSKIYGPKGVGALYIKTGLRILPFIFGGSQEKSLQPGTENIPNIVGFAKALEIAQSQKHQEKTRLQTLAKDFFQTLQSLLPGLTLNGPKIGERLANNINLQIPHVNGLELLLRLDEENIYISTGSACNLGKGVASSTLSSIGLNKDQMVRSIRISTGHCSNKEKLKTAAKKINEIALKKQKSQFKSL